MLDTNTAYKGRIAPTPTGYLHLGHGATFRTAYQRARQHNGHLTLRIEDIDPQRCKPQYTHAIQHDLHWLDISYEQGPILQSQRRTHYLNAWQKLKDNGHIYPCQRTRKDMQSATLAPHQEDEAAEPLYPPAWRPASNAADPYQTPAGTAWRFKVPDGQTITFNDNHLGPQQYTAGKDFGDFVIWRKDDVPAYELAVVADDIHMHITEIVRGRDLLKSTARQILLYNALNATPPATYHTHLICDKNGQRLAKRHAALAMHTLRTQNLTWQQALQSSHYLQPQPPPSP